MSTTFYSDYQWGEYWTPPQGDDSPIPEEVLYDFEQGRYRYCLNLEEVRAKHKLDADAYREQWMNWYENKRSTDLSEKIKALCRLVDAHNLCSSKQPEKTGGAV